MKPYAYNAVLFKKNPSLAAPGKIFVSADPETGRPLGSAPLASPPTNPTHLDANRLLSMIGDDQARDRAQLAIKKVTKFVESSKGEEFPQTSTVFQWYELEEFEAYRHLGNLMGWAYLANIDWSEGELRPDAACHML